MRLRDYQHSTIESIRIQGIELLEEIGRGAQGVVFKGRSQHQLVAVKVFFDKNNRFKKEAVALGRISDPSIPAIIEIGETSEFTYLVMEYIDGQTLAQEIKSNSLPEEVVIELGKYLARGLIAVHHRGLVHSDLKPSNILVDRQTFQPRMIDFGFAMNAQPEAQENKFFGTFLYSAPEQTGVLKREIDGRTDLYSLGIVLFECVTGRLPYASDDLSEVIRLHSSSEMPKAHFFNSNINPLFSAILSKLMAKDPDDRYQTAMSLLWDLENFSQLDESSLGAKHNQYSSAYEPPLIGREHEINSVTQAVDRSIEKQRLSVILIEGAPGAGKSRFVRSLLERVQAREIQFFKAKCQISEAAPLAMVRRLLEDHLREIRALPANLRLEKENQIRLAAGDYAAILKNFSPGLSEILKDVPALETSKLSQDQYYDALSHLLAGIATSSSLVGFGIDDVQWLDEGSRQVLKRLCSRLKDHACFLICTARNDCDSQNGLNDFTRSLEDFEVKRTQLSPLDQISSARLISYHLGERVYDSKLSQKLFELSEGSPFALVEYLQAMFDADCFSPSDRSWKVDFEKLEKLNLPYDVIQLVLKRIDLLNPKLREILSYAALCGSQIDSAVLAAIFEKTQLQIDDILNEALRSFLIEKGQWHGFRFTHDRVREAFLALMADPDKQKQAYQKIAWHFEHMTRSNRSISDVYSLARYYSASNWEKTLERAFEANLKAGLTALSDFANLEAKEFLSFALRAAETWGQATLEDLTTLRESLAETDFRLAQLNEAYFHYGKLLELSKDSLKRAKIRTRMSMVRLTTQKVIPANEELSYAFRELNVHPPSLMATKILLGLWYSLLAFLTYKTKIGFGSAQGLARERHRTLAEVTSYSTQIFYYHNDIPGIFYVAMKSLHHVHRIGISPEFCSSYIFMACLTGVLKLRKLLEFFSDGALRAAEQLSNPPLIAQAQMMRAISVNFTGAVTEAEKLSRKALIEFEAWIPPLEWLIGVGDYITALLYRGYFDEVITWGEKAYARIESNKEQAELVRVHGAYPIIASALTIRGHHHRAIEIFNDFRSRIESTPEPYLWNTYLACYLLSLIEQNDLGPVMDEAIEKHQSFRLNPLTCLFHFRQIFVTQAYARLAQYEAASIEDKPKRLQQLEKAYKELFWSAHVPMYLGHRSIIQAALARIKGDHKKAYKCLAQAEKTALRSDSPWMMYEILKEKALLLKSSQQPAQSKRQALMAHQICLDMGWPQRAEKIAQLFSLNPAASKAISSLGRSKKAATETQQSLVSLTYQKHRDSLMQLGLSLSQTVDPEEQVKIALTEIVRLLNGERAFLFLSNLDGSLQLKFGLNSQGEALENLTGFSRTVVDRVKTNKKAIILGGNDDGEISTTDSIHAYNLRSIIAAPLMKQEALAGVVYVDSQIAKGIFSQEDVEILTAMANHIAVALETAKTAQLLLNKRTLEKDLELAGIAQSLLLPQKNVFQNGPVKAVAFYRSASQTGGDWWNYHLDEKGSEIIVGDVTGHGAGSAMVSAAAIGTYKALRGTNNRTPTPEILKSLNQQFRDLVREEYSMTMVVLKLSADARELQIWTAAAPSVLVMDAQGEIDILNEISTPFGYADFQLGEIKRKLQPKDRIFIFTDGLFEFSPVNGTTWHEGALRRFFKTTRHLSLFEAREIIASTLQSLQGNNNPDDDMTFILIDIE